MQNTGHLDRHDTPFRPVLRHRGPCGQRHRCWKASCREAFDPMRTVEILDNRVIYFYCHRAVVPVDPVALAMLGLAS